MDSIRQSFSFQINSPGVESWIKTRGSELVTNCSNIQKEAINVLLEQKVREWYDPDQLARLIRPCIGLTVGQTTAARNFYDRHLEQLRQDHPKTKDSVLQKNALDKTMKYAERAHRQRALTIAQTELAKAYNFGADESIRIAQENYLIGKCIKRWNTSGDENVCSECNSLDGKEVGMEQTFYDGKKIIEEGMFPPLHPRCACAIQYIEVEAPKDEHIKFAASIETELFVEHLTGNEDRFVDHLYEYNYGQKDVITPKRLYNNLNKTEIGRETIKYVTDNPNIRINMCYNIDPGTILGDSYIEENEITTLGLQVGDDIYICFSNKNCSKNS